MDAKLTLKLDESVIQRAKLYAKKQDISLSKLIENYLSAITGISEKHVDISPLVESLSGVIDLKDATEQEDYVEYLSKKYR